MSRIFAISAVLMLLLNSAILSQSKVTQHRSEILDDGNYVVDWYIDYEATRVDFTVTVKTTGFVGFGLSPNGGMTGADIVIGGVRDGEPYFSVRVRCHG